MTKTLLLLLLLISTSVNILFYFKISSIQSKQDNISKKNNYEQSTVQKFDRSQIYFLGDYCKAGKSLELFRFKENKFELWKFVTTSFDKAKASSPNVLGKWKILTRNSASFSVLYNDFGEPIADYEIGLVEVGPTGKVISFSTEEDKYLFDLRDCF